MAEAIVSVLVEQLGALLYHHIENEVIMVVGVKEEIQELTNILSSIRAVLHYAEKKQFQDERVKVWLEDLMEAVYEIEDILEQWNSKNLKTYLKTSHVFCPCFRKKNTVFSRHSVGGKVKEIRKSLESIASRKDAFGFASGFEVEISQPRDITTSLVNEPDVYGREGDRDIIINKIFGESGHRGVGVPVISIVGGGGLGKTTLAQYILHHQKVVEHFGKPLWVCVSEPFDRISIAKAIVVEAGGKLPDNNEWNTLHSLLKETLKNKLFLLILDDVWTEDFYQWNPFKICLDGGAAGSRILITTRKVRVAEMMSSVYTHHIQGLNDENSWSLLQFASSIGDDTQDYETFENIGKAIALKSKGVPFSIKTLGSLLRFKKTKHEWERVLKSEMWSLPEFVDTVNPALSLSYYDLPSSWKPCFLYCATFPKDHIIKKDVLIKLWMAHGFLYSSDGRELEEIGEDYFNGIISHSLLQDVVKNDVGDIQSCKLHDLVHDFVHFLSNKKTCIIEGDDVTFKNTKLHHLTVCNLNKDITTVSSFDTMKSVRTLNLNNRVQVGGLWKIFCHCTKLRSLDISRTGLELLPPEIKNLIHLRYLDLSGNGMRELPNTLGDLCNLQTLKLNLCLDLCELPASMLNLINLRHLELDHTEELRSLPKGIEKLPSLCSLSKFIVEEGRKLSDIKGLDFQGKIEISGLCRVKDGDEAKEAELGNRRGIRNLTLNFVKYENVSEGYEERMEGVLEALQPPPDLEELSIKQYAGSKLPSWMNDRALVFPKLIGLGLFDMRYLEEWVLPFERSDMIQIMPCLRKLYIYDAFKLKALPAVWKLESLEELTLWGLSSVTRVGPEFFGISENYIIGLRRGGESLPIIIFPKLKKLYIQKMEELEKWDMKLPNWREDISFLMPCLKELGLYNCPKLKVIPRNIFSYQLVMEDTNNCPELKRSYVGANQIIKRKEVGESSTTNTFRHNSSEAVME